MYLLIDPREVQKSHKGSIFRFLEKIQKIHLLISIFTIFTKFYYSIIIDKYSFWTWCWRFRHFHTHKTSKLFDWEKWPKSVKMAKLRFPFQLWLDNRKLKAFEAVQLDQFETLTLKFYDNDLMTSIYLQNKKFDFFLLYQKIEKITMVSHWSSKLKKFHLEKLKYI